MIAKIIQFILLLINAVCFVIAVAQGNGFSIVITTLMLCVVLVCSIITWNT